MPSTNNPPVLPTVGEFNRAMEIYLSCAYTQTPVPPLIADRCAPLKNAPASEPIQPAWFETSLKNERTVYHLRLGQAGYPHMKLNLEPAPDGGGYLYMVDAHDTHLHAPANSPDGPALARLRAGNARMAEQIEQAWVRAGLPTFRGWLRDSLRRKQARSTGAAGGPPSRLTDAPAPDGV